MCSSLYVSYTPNKAVEKKRKKKTVELQLLGKRQVFYTTGRAQVRNTWDSG